MRNENFPTELNFHYMQWVNRNEISSACPSCGGVPHRNGEFPDRFRIWLRSKTTGETLGWCRKCGHIWLPGKRSLSQEEHRNWIAERETYEQIEKQKAENALELLRKERLWLKYHEQLTDEAKSMYAARKITGWWLDYWMLGYEPAHSFWHSGVEFLSPTLTIPIFQIGGNVVDIWHRLLNPADGIRKYRREKSGLPISLYYTDYDKGIGERVLLVEGQFKAMTTYIALDNPNIPVIGLPGCTPSEDLLEPLQVCERVYICLDPDTRKPSTNGGKSPTKRLAEIFKNKARFIILPEKIDDMISMGYLGREELNSLINGARQYE